MEYQSRRLFHRPKRSGWDPAVWRCQTVSCNDDASPLSPLPLPRYEILANRSRSIELQRRLDSDPKLSRISVLGVDPGMMPTHITTATLNWLIRSLMAIVVHIASRLSPNGMLRLPRKSAGDVLAAAMETNPLLATGRRVCTLTGLSPRK